MGDEPLPSPSRAGPDGLLAVGGDLAPERLIDAYRRGVFPWPTDDDVPLLWWSPDPRFVLYPSELHVSASLEQRLRSGRFTVTFDTAFERVIRACAAAPRPGQSGTWITAEMIEGFARLHRLGWAHSVESWHGDELAGGLYGVAVGGAFCGESMFAAQTDASKVAFVTLVRRLEAWGFAFVDCQLETEHLKSLGARNVPRHRFLRELAAAQHHPDRLTPWR